jgi:phosphate transport system substrate-binding protein
MFAALVAVGVSAFGTSVATAAAATTLNGAGATFSQPLWQQVGSNLKSKGLTLNYQGIGSGAGVSQFVAGTVDFAASDPPLTQTQIGLTEKNGGPTVHVPVAFGAITVSYHIPGVKSGLRLNGGTIANIYLGKITKWNDAAIKKLNPKVKLPDLAITVYRRAESSGTTAGFTLFLSKYSSEWAAKAGPPGNTAKWPVGTGAQGNAGVAAGVKQRVGAIGYVEQAYAVQNKFTFAAVQNRKKEWIYPSLKSVSLAGKGLKVQKSLRFTAIDNPVKGAYPLVSQTFMINHRNICGQKGVNADKAAAIVGVINYIYSKPGTKTLNRLIYAAIPADLKKKVFKQVKTFNCNGAKIKAKKF